MILDFLTNPLVILFGLTIIITVLMYIFVGNKKKNKNKKIEKVYDLKSDEKDKSKNSKDSDSNLDKTEKNESGAPLEKDEKNIDGFDYVDDDSVKSKEKKVTKVYIRKVQDKKEEQKEEDSKYQQLSERAEFVKTSKYVSKLNGFRNDKEELNREELGQALKEEIENCDTCNDMKSRFDRSRRLSKIIKDDNFDKMFATHITEHYLNIDPERHVSKTIEEDIYRRANELIQNGETRALDSKSQIEYNNLKSDKDKLRFWLEHSNAKEEQESLLNQEEEKFKEDLDFSLRNLILTESIIKRKGRK